MTAIQPLPLSPARAAGPFVFVSGQLAMRDGRIVGGDVAAQTSLAIDAIEAQLAPFGVNLAAVVKTTVWLTSVDDFPAFNAAYAARFSEPYPTRATVVGALMLPDALVEIEAIAFRGDPSVSASDSER